MTSCFLNNLFGSPIDFPVSQDGKVDKQEHVKLLIDICEEPKKMLEYFHRIRDDFVSGDELESRKSRADDFRQEGNDHFVAGRHLESLACYREAMKLTPNDAKLYSNACLCNMALGHFEDAVVDGFASFYADSHWSKSYGMMIASYCYMGYMDVVNNYLKHALNNFGTDYYNEATRKIDHIKKSHVIPSPCKLNKADLVATVTRLFQTNHPPRTYAFLLTHIVQHCEWGDEDLSVEKTLSSLDFVRRVLQVPYLKGLISPDLNLASLEIDDCLNLVFLLRLLGAILMSKDNAAIPDQVLSFASSIGNYWTKESTAKLIASETVPFGHVLFDYYVKLLTTISTSKPSRSRFFQSTRTEWLLHLPVVCYSMLNPAAHPGTYFALIRLICLLQIRFPELSQKSPPLELAKAVSLYASFGIICDRLMDYDLPFECAFSELPIDEAFYVYFKEISLCDDAVIRHFANIPEVWLMFARKLAKNPLDPSENAYALMAMESFLRPWAFECDDDLKPPLPNCFEEGPWFDMLLYSLPKLMMPKRQYRDTIISAVLPAARLASASRKFAEKLVAQVPILNFNKFERGIDEDGAKHFFAVMLSVVDNSTISDIVLNEPEKFDTAVFSVVDAVMNSEPDFYDEMFDAGIYHGCIAVERLLKIACRLEASKDLREEDAGKEIRQVVLTKLKEIYGEENPHELSDLFNSLISWVKGPVKSKKSKGKKKQIASRKKDEKDDEKVKLSSELSSPAVHKLFEALSEADEEIGKILQQVKNRRRF